MLCVLAFSAAAFSQASPSKILRPPIVGIAAIGLKTNNMGAASRFYGGVLGFSGISLNKSGPALVSFKVNDRQYIVLHAGLKNPKEDRLSYLAFETTDARGLRAFLSSKGIKATHQVKRQPDGNLAFDVVDPAGRFIEFVQFVPGSIYEKEAGRFLPATRISQHIIHAGFVVQDRAAEDHFYKDILGFKETWHGGMKDNETDWVDMRVPDGKDWLEYMLNVHNPDPKLRGIMNHLALGVPDVNAANQELMKRGFKGEQPKIGRDGKWQLNLYDPNLTRVELMEPSPVEKPCCSPIEP